MQYYPLKIKKLTRQLPIVSLTPRIKVASFNLLGDRKLVEVLAKELSKKLKPIRFDYLVGPEVKVVPLLHELSKILKKDRYIVCRKSIYGYMVSPKKTMHAPFLVIDGNDALALRNKRVVIVDDVVTSGRTLDQVEELMIQAKAKVVAKSSVFIQQTGSVFLKNIIFLYSLPVFSS